MWGGRNSCDTSLNQPISISQPLLPLSTHVITQIEVALEGRGPCFASRLRHRRPESPVAAAGDAAAGDEAVEVTACGVV